MGQELENQSRRLNSNAGPQSHNAPHFPAVMIIRSPWSATIGVKQQILKMHLGYKDLLQRGGLIRDDFCDFQLIGNVQSRHQYLVRIL